MSFAVRAIAVPVLLCSLAIAAEKKPVVKEGWLNIHSAHFEIITDAGEKKGREVVVRLEQMRTVFGDLIMHDKLMMPVPLQVLALKSDSDYERMSPQRKRTAITDPGFFIAGEDKNIIVLDLFAEEPWRAIAHPFAHMLLDGNYPPTQSWFDEGLAEYFGSIRLGNKTVDIGSDPQLVNKYSEDLLGDISDVRHPAKSLTELLSGPLWLNMTDFLGMRLSAPPYREGTHHTLFYAQSWILVHYLLSKKMMPQVGTYFGLVQVQKLPIEQAVKQAFGMTPDQLESTLKDYFHSLTPLFTAQDRADAAPDSEGDVLAARVSGSQVTQLPVPFGPGDVSIVVKKVEDDDAHALIAEAMTRIPEHREEGFKQLQALAQEPADNEFAHRALAFAYIQNKDFKQARSEISQALEEDTNDPWARYYEALLRIRMASGKPMEGGLAAVQQDLRGVLEWNPQFAEAHHLLALAELQGGGTHAALDTIRAAIQLAPRNRSYLLNLADIYIAEKKWDEATSLLEQLKGGNDAKIASAARKKLDEMPFIKKYGIQPDESAAAQQTRVIEANSGISNPLPDEPDEKPTLKERAPDKRPVKYLKGKIVSVDCSKAPEAIVTVLSGLRSLKLHTADYNSVALVGATKFSCEWRNQHASVNYRAGNGIQGDLVSVEID